MNISYEVMATNELAKILDVDVDRIILPVKAELLLKLPPLLLVELVCNHPTVCKGCKECSMLRKNGVQIIFDHKQNSKGINL